MRIRHASMLLALCFAAGCSLVVSSLVSDPVADCDGHEDGTPCTAAEICISGVCTYSQCGDGYVDTSLGEQCDDSNLNAGDGCEPGRCRFTCSRDEQCIQESACLGNNGCDLSTHTCNPPAPLSGASCVREDSSAGTCRSGTCAAAGCGNGVVGPGEECDDTTAGCAADCQYVCDAATPCSTDDVCATPYHCNLATHDCDADPPPNCDDTDPCSATSCDRTSGCAATIVDVDGDGYAPFTCAAASPYEGGDCDDSDSARHPDASEMLNTLDDDCDTIVDENPGVNCQRDFDGDGWGDPTDVMFLSSCPEGRVAARGQDDCDDHNSNVNPMARTPSATPYCKTGTVQGGSDTGFSCSDGSMPSWDYDCNGSQVPSVPTMLSSCSGLAACGGSFWATAVPMCGARGTLRSCVSSCLLNICSCKNSDTNNVAQRCL